MAANPETKEFLLKVIDILLDYIRTQNDRNERVLEFHHPEEMKQLLDLDVPENGLPLQQLIQDCATTLKYQVRTGKYKLNIYILEKEKKTKSFQSKTRASAKLDACICRG